MMRGKEKYACSGDQKSRNSCADCEGYIYGKPVVILDLDAQQPSPYSLEDHTSLIFYCQVGTLENLVISTLEINTQVLSAEKRSLVENLSSAPTSNLYWSKMVKEKPNSTRIYDDDGYRKRAACICVRNESETEVLMVTSSRHSDHWIIPGGGVEPDETYMMAAVREVTEEAGVRGKLDRCLGTFENQERRHRTAVYVMVVTEELPEWDDARNIGRKRKWFSVDEAIEQLSLHKPTHLNYLQQLRANAKNNHETESRAEPT